MSAAHFRSNAKVAAIFDLHVAEGRLDEAVQSVIDRGLRLDPADLIQRRHREMDRQQREMIPSFGRAHAAELQREAKAVQVLRAARIAWRAQEIEDAFHAAQKAEWRHRATVEIDAEGKPQSLTQL